MYAALRGVKKGNNDMTSYWLIIKLDNGQTLKILETKNAKKIRKEVSGKGDISDFANLRFLYCIVDMLKEILGARGRHPGHIR